jgi:hypothetical protein
MHQILIESPPFNIEMVLNTNYLFNFHHAIQKLNYAPSNEAIKEMQRSTFFSSGVKLIPNASSSATLYTSLPRVSNYSVDATIRCATASLKLLLNIRQMQEMNFELILNY